MENVDRSFGLALPLFLIGLGAGIAVALLIAPAPGTATRRLIGRKTRQGQAWVKEKTAAMMKQAAEVIGPG